jgi:hypothetical protein
MFETEEVAGIRGLTALTEPGAGDRVGAVVDVAVIGARGDGKTQFIVHAIRTLRAYAPVLDGVEHQYNRDVLQVVMNAREPRPEATAPGVVPHYVFRIRPDSLESQVGFFGRVALLMRAAGLGVFWFLALANAIAIAAGLVYLRGGFDPMIAGAAGGVLLLGAGLGHEFSRRRFLQAGEIEIVFWDVAGEHVYSDSAADYYSFLSALVRERQRRATSMRSYAFAPVLVCNPLSLGVRAETSAYARLRQLIPLFASLSGPSPRAMVAINRWAVVERVCAPDSDRDEIVAVLPRSRDRDDDHAPEIDDAAETKPMAPTLALPLVKRDVVRRHCLDAEDGNDDDVRFSYLRYDAGSQCEVEERAWDGYDELPDAARLRWRAPTSSSPSRVIDYIYEEGPRSFEGSARREFLRWLAGMSYHDDLEPMPPETEDATDDREIPRPLDPLPSGERLGRGEAVVDEAAFRPSGRAASETAEAMQRIWSSQEKAARDAAEANANGNGSVGAADDDPWTGEGTAPGIGPGERPTETPAAGAPTARLGAVADEDDDESVLSGGFRSGT